MEASPSNSDQSATNPRAQRPIKRDMAKQKSGKSNQRQATNAPESTKPSTDAGAAVADKAVAATVKTAAKYGGDAPLDVAALMERPCMWPPAKEEEEIINSVLYGPSRRRRLPVFKEICPD